MAEAVRLYLAIKLSRASLTVRILRYKIEKGLRAVYIESCKRSQERIALLEFGIVLISQNDTVIEQTEMEVAPRYKLNLHCSH